MARLRNKNPSPDGQNERSTYPEGLLASLIGFGGVVTFDSQLVSLANEVCTQSIDDIRTLQG